MGRLFVADLEGPVYTCRHCRSVGIAVYVPANRILPYFPDSFGKLYHFFRCLNVVIGTDEVTITPGAHSNFFDKRMRDVFCVSCGSRLGFYIKLAFGNLRYNEGNFYINRFKLHGPPEGSDDENPEVVGN